MSYSNARAIPTAYQKPVYKSEITENIKTQSARMQKLKRKSKKRKRQCLAKKIGLRISHVYDHTRILGKLGRAGSVKQNTGESELGLGGT